MSSEQLQAILDAHALWAADGETGARANLGGADLSRANLGGADLSRANLSEADVSRANISRANLSRADLSWANLSEADLSEANLSRADLSWANLSWADLSWANLGEANLRGADLREANLGGANLGGADLGEANLSGANLSGATGLLVTADWLAANFKRTRGGILVYKSFGAHYDTPESWTIEPGAEISETVNPLPTLDCACGVNVATLDWCRANCTGNVWELLVKWEWMIGAVVPYQTDGKFRVPRARLIRVVLADEVAA